MTIKDNTIIQPLPSEDLISKREKQWHITLPDDFRNNKESPNVCVWSHEESGDSSPVTYKVPDSFSSFIEMLF